MFTLKPFPPYPASTPRLQTMPLPAGLPPAVTRFYRQVMGRQVLLTHSAVISGRGTLRFKTVSFPIRWRFSYCAGACYRHYIEATILGFPVLKVNERYLEGHARLNLPFGVVEHEPKVDMAANLGLWAESIWLPSIFLTDARVRWEGIDDVTACLVVPFGNTEDRFTVSFDPATGRLRSLETKRYRDASDVQKIGWRNDVLGWKSFHGIQLPASATVTWLDQPTPWLSLLVEEVVYNVDVAPYLHAQGR